MIDIVYIAWKRPEFTAASLTALLENTNLDLVNTVYIYTDGDSVDTTGIIDKLETWIHKLDRDKDRDRGYTLDYNRRGGPVAVLNDYLEHSKFRAVGEPAEFVAKIDNDLIVCPQWLEVCSSIMHANPSLGLLGIEPTPFYCETDLHNRFQRIAEIFHPGAHRELEMCRYIGGIGLFRRTAFADVARPVPTRGGRFGFTGWQIENEQVNKAWIDPPLPMFLLDHLNFEPWKSLSARYEAEGTQRRQWGYYPDSCSSLWEWWLDPNPKLKASVINDAR